LTPHTAPPQVSLSGRTRVLGVKGWPVEHSLSPLMQNAALRAAGLNYIYVPFPIAPERFETAVRGLAAAGVVGLNCTVPHKHAALRLCDALSTEAQLAQAVNTLHFTADGIYGTNSDVEGYMETVRRDAGFDFAGRRVVQFGAGGAGRAIALGALRGGAAELVLVNRTLEKAEILARDLLRHYPGLTVATLSPESHGEEVQGALARADLVVNATSLGLREEDAFPCDVADLSPQALVFDAAYSRDGATPWLRAAAERGCRTLDGLGMLVRQGAASFRLWTGVEPDLEVMFAALRGARDER
jgi:shikimate dehydrogenase